MEFYDEKIKALAIEIYELDAEVYKKLGSSLGRVFGCLLYTSDAADE